MRANLLRTCQFVMLFTALTLAERSAVHAQGAFPATAPVRDIFMRSRWEFLPPILETEENLSLYSGYEANGGPGQKSYSRFGATQHLFLPDGVISFNGEGFVTNYGHGGATALLHTRQLVGNSLWGAGASYMVQESEADNIYEQGAVHVEVFPNEAWSVRANAYVPVGTHRREIFNGGPVPLPATFSQNNIAIPTLTNRTLEAALGGVDVELSRQISGMAMEVFGGYYKHRATAGKNAEGGKLGIRGYITRRLTGHFTVSNDNRFGTQVFGGVMWYLGGAAGLAPQDMRDKLMIPVERNHQIIIDQTDEVIPGTIIATDMGAPITVTHVRNGAGGTNSGTFENPFNTNMLPGTQGTDIVYMHGGAAPYVNGYTLAPGQRFLGEGAGNQHLVDTDQFGSILLGAGSGSLTRSAVQGPLVGANSAEISNVLLEPVGTGISLPNLAGLVDVNRSVIDGGVNGGAVGIDVLGGSGDFTFADVTVRDTSVAGLRITGGSSNVVFGTLQPTAPAIPDFLPSMINQSGTGSAVTVAGGHTGTLQLLAGNTVTAINGTGLQFDDADGNYSFDGDVALSGGDAGIDIIGGSDGTFTFTNTDITDPTGSAIQVGTPGVAGSGGTADITLASMSSITQANNAPTVVVLGNHTGTLTHEGSIAATDGTGLQFGEAATGANGNYNFNGSATLNGGDAGVDILGNSLGTFTFADLDITSPTGPGPAFNINGMGGTSLVNVNYIDGAIIQTNNFAAFEVQNHDTGLVDVGADITSTNGTGLQFDNADGVYNFNGATLLNGGDAGIDIVNDSDGVFSFRRPTIINTAGGTGINVDGGVGGQLAQTTVDGGAITTNGGTGLNINNTGLTTVLQPTDISTIGARAVDINQSLVNVLLRNVSSEGSPAEGIDIDGTLDGSTFTINGSARVLMAGTNGIDIQNSRGDFSITSIDIDGTGVDGVRLNNNIGNTSVTFNGGAIDGTPLDGFFIQNTNDVTINSILFGNTTPIGQDAIDYRSNDGIARNVALTNNVSGGNASVGARGIAITQQNAGRLNAAVTDNRMSSGGQAFVTMDSGMPGTLVLQLDNNLWSTAVADFASDVAGSGMNSTIVTSFGGNSSSGRGMLFDRVTFDATGALLAGGQVQGPGITTVNGSGDGLSFINPTGDLRIGEVEIVNFNGTGLEVFTKGLGTTFNLQTGGGGSINTTSGNALFLDPLTGNINIAEVTSSGSMVGGAPTANSSSTGDGIFIDEFTASGGPGADALTIGTLNVTTAARFGARIEDSQGQFDLGTINLDGITLDGISLSNNNDANTGVTVSGGTIRDVTGDGINSTNTSLSVNNVQLGNIIVDPMMMADDVPERILGDGIDIRQTDGVNRTYSITNNSSMIFTDPMAMQDVALINGRALNLQTGVANLGTLTATVSGNDLQSLGTALRVNTTGNANANIISLNVSNNTFETRLPVPMMMPPFPVLTMDLAGVNTNPTTNSLRITGFRNNVVTGNGVGGGVLVDNATFVSVDGGTMMIGDPGTRVGGDGFILRNSIGSLSFDQLDIANEGVAGAGNVGLLVDTKTGGTNFTLSTMAGSIDTIGGPAMFLDPLTVNMTLDTVMSAGSMGGPTAASAGDGLHLDGVGGMLTIADLQISDTAMEGVQVLNSSVNFSIQAGAIGTTVGDGLNIVNGGTFTMDNTAMSTIGGFTGDITGTLISGSGNTVDVLSQPALQNNPGSILFNGGADQLD